jgi:hypothetical protein
MNLSQSIFEELILTKTKYRNKAKGSTKVCKKIFEKYIAEEEIIIGLLFLLHEKSINYIISKIKYKEK